jgi:DNA-binding response OmpR family regulator
VANLLIVDDTKDTCDLLVRLFTRIGHKCQCLYDGTGVVDLLRTDHFDLVLLDVMMPQVDGFSVLRAIRAEDNPDVARTPVAMYTAISDPTQQERAVAMGADEWVVKGTPFALLQRRLERFLTDGSACPVT